jgi:alanyl-tRNA synthetase
MAAVVIDQFGDDYPNLVERRSQIERVLRHEEETFGRTLTAGMSRFQAEADHILSSLAKDASQYAVEFPGETAFRLYDTFGFPLDLTIDLAREKGMTVDQAGFDAAMAAQREVSRGGATFKDTSRDRAALYVTHANELTEFTGYDDVESSAEIVALLGEDGPVETVEAGQAIEVILDRTPFYGESGGQVGDKGSIRTDTGVIDVDDTFKPAPGLHVHRGSVAEGFVQVGDAATARIDAARRKAIMRNHTATHLLHRALRIVLGDDTHQAGSLVAPDRLRFDFTSIDAMSSDQVNRVAEIVNEQAVASLPVGARETSYDEAVAGGAMALFGEKYGDRVRVVEIDGFSQELCGGTHLSHTGEVGPFVVVSEGSVAAGVRRIEALTGSAAIERNLRQQALLESLAREVRVPWTDLPDQLNVMRSRLRESEHEVARLRGQLAESSIDDLIQNAIDVDGIRLVAASVPAESRDDLRQIGDRLRDKLGSGVVVLGAVIEQRPSLLAMVTSDVVGRGVKAGELVKESAVHVDGRGGGRPDLAEAGGKNPAGLDRAISSVEQSVRSQLAKSL